MKKIETESLKRKTLLIATFYHQIILLGTLRNHTKM